MATISFEFSDKAYEVLEELAEWRDVSINEFARRALLEKMEDTEDLKAVEEALREDDGETISHEELWRRLKT
ncbi:MAG: ribbon-helix-helix protein, CopG family [Selenomonadaceae bacterium]|nr:ribbon-helix-helix protein, CopG family [Selenomonadaceae bacterium]MBQ4403134.1 ribbon-helix-helix protein, CopG family [Selenomonadaceae bacterium]